MKIASFSLEGQSQRRVGIVREVDSVDSLGPDARVVLHDITNPRTHFTTPLDVLKAVEEGLVRIDRGDVAGGLEIEDPAADLAVIAALCSSAGGRLLAEKCLFMGEVGLTGEVRPVAQLPLRLQEGARLGFSCAAVPRLGLEGKSPLDLFPETSVERLRGKAWLKGLVEE